MEMFKIKDEKVIYKNFTLFEPNVSTFQLCMNVEYLLLDLGNNIPKFFFWEIVKNVKKCRSKAIFHFHS